jgi:GT2 family glycosyltransferase/2-polyprenyl-3-methyl-5-hydroxy-6-metoxy-1,4-benzoquinol methylase/uncharacterized protein YukE
MSKYNTSIDIGKRKSISITAKSISPSSKVLEFGPAYGDLTKYLKDELGCYMAIVEIDENSGKVASQYADNFLIGEEQGDIEKFIWCDHFKGMLFDYIILNDVLEHLLDPGEVLLRAKELLSADGSILVTIPNIAHNSVLIGLINDDFKYTELGLLDNTHIRFFTRKTFLEMSSEAGFIPTKERAIYSRVGTNEVEYDYSSVNKNFSKELKRRDLGEVYQYYFELKNRDGVVSNAIEREIFQNYYNSFFEASCFIKTDSCDVYRETMSLKKYFNPDSGRIEFDLSGISYIAELRLDPIESNCIIKGARFFVENKDRTVKIDPVGTNALLQIKNDFVFTSIDPQFYFDFKKIFDPKRIFVEFDCLDYDIEEEGFTAYKQADFFRKSVEELNRTVEELNRNVEELNITLEELNRNINERDNQITEFENVIAERDKQINEIIAERDTHISALYNSTSWKITKPVRFFSRRFKKVFSATGSLPPNINPNTEHVSLSHDVSCFDRNDYSEWIRRYDTITDEARDTMRGRVDNFLQRPLISVLMPIVDPNSAWLVEAIDSVLAQVYMNWELCVAVDASAEENVRLSLECYKDDPRIKSIYQEDLNVTTALKMALELVNGEYTALFNQNDILAEHALFWVVETINRKPEVRLLYSDEDKLDEQGRRIEPYFKCDWNVDLFYSNNIVRHLSVFETSLIHALGGFREGFEGAHDYDLALRCIEHIESSKIAHVPRILYHYRQHATDASTRASALVVGKKALDGHFKRIGLQCDVELLDFGMYRIRYSLPEEAPLVSIVIPTRNGFKLIQRCIDSILTKTGYDNYEIIIIDNASDDADTICYFERLKNDPRVFIMRDERPFNYSVLNNDAVKKAKGDLICLLNNDIEIISNDWLSEMVSFAVQPGVGAVGARLWYPSETLQHGGVITGICGMAAHSHKNLPRNSIGYFGRANIIQGLSAVTGACLLIKKKIYEEVGGLNETDLQIALNDVDFCLKVRSAGYRNIWTPYAELYHYESATRGYEDTAEKKSRFGKEIEYLRNVWGDTLLVDPAYSPNLTLEYDDFSLAWPPRVEIL